MDNREKEFVQKRLGPDNHFVGGLNTRSPLVILHLSKCGIRLALVESKILLLQLWHAHEHCVGLPFSDSLCGDIRSVQWRSKYVGQVRVASREMSSESFGLEVAMASELRIAYSSTSRVRPKQRGKEGAVHYALDIVDSLSVANEVEMEMHGGDEET